MHYYFYIVVLMSCFDLDKERVGIIHLFDTVVTADEDEVEKGKPAPDIFLEAAKRLGIAPEKCIGFEGKSTFLDSRNFSLTCSLQTNYISVDADFGMQALNDAKYLYSCDVRLFHLYPRNVEERMKVGKGRN
jgi:hypothetical protein